MTDPAHPPACLIAGAGPGMGLAIAARFAREGFALGLIARTEATLAGLAASLGPHGVRVETHTADLADPGATAAAIDALAGLLGGPAVLVYNASRWIPAAAMTLDPAAFRAELDLSVTGALVAAQRVHPAMRAAGRGTILFTGGGLALAPQYGGEVPGLTAGKSALRGLGFAIAAELARDGIHLGMVTIAGTVAPGGAFDPDRIAERFWALHLEPPGAFTVETIFTGA